AMKCGSPAPIASRKARTKSLRFSTRLVLRTGHQSVETSPTCRNWPSARNTRTVRTSGGQARSNRLSRLSRSAARGRSSLCAAADPIEATSEPLRLGDERTQRWAVHQPQHIAEACPFTSCAHLDAQRSRIGAVAKHRSCRPIPSAFTNQCERGAPEADPRREALVEASVHVTCAIVRLAAAQIGGRHPLRRNVMVDHGI